MRMNKGTVLQQSRCWRNQLGILKLTKTEHGERTYVILKNTADDIFNWLINWIYITLNTITTWFENRPSKMEVNTLLRGNLPLNNSQSLVKTSQSLDKTKKMFDTIYKALLVEIFFPKLFTCIITSIFDSQNESVPW